MGEAEQIYEDELDRSHLSGSVVDIEQLCDQNPSVANALRQLHLERTVSDIGKLPQAKPRRRAQRFRTLPHALGTELGSGGMGIVHRAVDEDLQRSVAVKIVRFASPEYEARFLREARVTAQLDHPAIPPVHEILETEDSRPCFSMQLIQGKVLKEVIPLAREARDGWSIDRVLGVLERVGEALAYAHSRGVVHRDVKPDNIMVGPFGETYVMDWGLARVGKKSDVTVQETSDPWPAPGPTELAGTPSYMPPEQALSPHDADERSDIYALGATLYHVLCGERPYHDVPDRMAVLRHSPPAPLAVERVGAMVTAQLGTRRVRQLIAIQERAMARVAADRYATVDALVQDLGAFRQLQPVSVGDSSTLLFWELAWRRSKVKIMLAAAAVAALLVGGVVAIISLNRAVDAERAKVNLVADTSSLAIDQGLWRQTIVACDAAIAGGHADEGGLRLRKLEAMIALNDAPGVMRELALVETLARTDPSLRGRVLLWQGDLGLASDKGTVTDTDLVRRALKAGLTGAHEQYALALTAATSPGAAIHLEAALALDPNFFRARELLAVIYVFLGRSDAARECLLLLRHSNPNDPGEATIRALLAAMEGNRSELDRSLLEIKKQADPPFAAAMTALLQFTYSIATKFREVNFTANDWTVLDVFPVVFQTTTLIQQLNASQSPEQSLEGRLLLPFPPTLKRLADLNPQTLTTLLVGKPASSVRVWKDIAARHPIAEFHLLAALGEFGQSYTTGYEEFVKAIEAPTCLGLRRGQVHAMAAACAFERSQREENPVWRERAVHHAREALTLEPLPTLQATVLSGVMLRSGELEGCWDWLRRIGEAGEPQRLYLEIRADAALQSKRYAEALRYADRAIQAGSKESDSIQGIREAALLGLKSMIPK